MRKMLLTQVGSGRSGELKKESHLEKKVKKSEAGRLGGVILTSGD